MMAYKRISKEPAMLAAYTAKRRRVVTAYNLALKDFLRPPFITTIDASGYHGNPGEKISVIKGGLAQFHWSRTVDFSNFENSIRRRIQLLYLFVKIIEQKQ